jgi:hypothetical protein
MRKSMLIAAGGGGLSAIAWLAAPLGLPGGVILACFTPLPLLVVGLALGPAAAAVAAGAGVAAILTGATFAAAAAYAGMHAVPSWLVVHQALSSHRAATKVGSRAATTEHGAPAGGQAGGADTGCILAMIAVLIAGLSGIAAIAIGSGGDIAGALQARLDQATALSMKSLPEEVRENFVQSAAPFAVGLFGISWQILLAANSVFAQRILARRGWAIRPTPAWSSLSLPHWLAWPLVGTAAVAIVTAGDVQYLARNIVIILATPYFLLGLVVVHTLARNSPARGLLLTAFYIILMIFTVAVGAIVAGLGMIEQWAGLRGHIAPPKSKE